MTGLNRTFTELKLYITSIKNLRDGVLIEPLWNWNERGDYAKDRQNVVLIEPLWNWNM